MKQLLSGLLAVLFALTSASVLACPDSKSDQQISKPDKTKA